MLIYVHIFEGIESFNYFLILLINFLIFFYNWFK